MITVTEEHKPCPCCGQNKTWLECPHCDGNEFYPFDIETLKEKQLLPNSQYRCANCNAIVYGKELVKRFREH